MAIGLGSLFPEAWAIARLVESKNANEIISYFLFTVANYGCFELFIMV